MQGALGKQRPLVMVDVVLFTLVERELAVLLAERPDEPFAGRMALPGGYVHVDEDRDLTDAARRVLAAKIGFNAPYLEQLYTFSGVDRDPRGWSVCVAFFALVPRPELTKLSAGELIDCERLPPLPFDHSEIIRIAKDRLRNKASYSTLPTFLIGEPFTLAELRRVYEKTLAVNLDPASFRTKILSQRIIEPLKGRWRRGSHRPAQLYRRTARGIVLFDRVVAIAT